MQAQGEEKHSAGEPACEVTVVPSLVMCGAGGSYSHTLASRVGL